MKTFYGLPWDDEIPKSHIELWCYRHQHLVEEFNGDVRGRSYHMAQAIRELFTPEQVVWHRWLDEHIDIWCNDDFATVWGSAACGKSNDFGLLCLVDWWSAPEDTCTFVCSTTKEMLEKRIWESIIRYFNVCQGRVPGKISRKRTAIINAQDMEQGDEVKAGITGVAVQMGSTDQAKSSLIGAHLPYVRLVVDEMQATRRAAVEARSNLSKGCKEFKFIGMGNPMSFLDVLGEFSEPDDPAGYASVSPSSKKWKTRYGWTYHFDGFDSPAITEPNGEELYPFLINMPQIQKEIKECGGEEDHPNVWTMCKGFVPPEGIANTVLSETFIIKFNMRSAAVWEHDYITVAGVDPAFTSGGDKCIYVAARVGILEGSQEIAIEFQTPDIIQIKATSPLPAVYQIAEQVKALCARDKVKSIHLGVDETGTQTAGDVMEEQKLSGLHRVNFGQTASNLPVSASDPTPGDQKYKNKVTELWYNMRQFGQHGQIRNLPREAAREFCERLVIPGTKITVEPKTDMKLRLNRSPDEADACAVALDVVRLVLGTHPGATKANPAANMGYGTEEMLENDMLGADDLYMHDEFGNEVMA